MEIKTYKAPQAKVIEVNVHGVLCQSTGDTEKFVKSDYSYNDDDFE